MHGLIGKHRFVVLHKSMSPLPGGVEVAAACTVLAFTMRSSSGAAAATEWLSMVGNGRLAARQGFPGCQFVEVVTNTEAASMFARWVAQPSPLQSGNGVINSRCDHMCTIALPSTTVCYADLSNGKL
jgi:hypothetical protein